MLKRIFNDFFEPCIIYYTQVGGFAGRTKHQSKKRHYKSFSPEQAFELKRHFEILKKEKSGLDYNQGDFNYYLNVKNKYGISILKFDGKPFSKFPRCLRQINSILEQSTDHITP